MKHIVIIGGGVAGLAAACKVRRAEAEGHDVGFTLIEKDERLGGKVASDTVDGFVVDGGPDCFLTAKPAVHRVARLAGIEDDKLPSDEARKGTFILSRGRLHRMPEGVMMFAPTKFWPFATTGLFSLGGKLRMGMDAIIPRKKVPPGEINDETLESFIVRRMGRECLDRLAEPLVGGVHASDPATMSLAATFPSLLEMEQKHGSLLRAFLAQRRMIEAMRRKYPPDPKNPRTFFTSFARGMGELPEAMTRVAGKAGMRIGTTAVGLERRGELWLVHLSTGETLEADGVIVAIEGWAAASLAEPVSAPAAAALKNIPYSSAATVSFGFDSEDIGFDLNAFGVLCPMAEKRALLAATYSSTKWPGRAPAGRALIRGFLGGPHNQAIMERSDDELSRLALSEMRSILGLRAEPSLTRVFRWTDSMPQYTMGHLDRVAVIEGAAAGLPGLAFAGAAYHGVGVPNCIESGEQAVSKVLADRAITLEEDSAPPEKRLY